MSLLNTLNGDSRVIAYRPELRNIFSGKRLSATSTILFQQILFRFKPDKNKKGIEFYKFKEPCEHRLYREGDSWVEELGFTKKEFDTALKHIAYGFSKSKEETKVDGYKTLEDCCRENAIVYRIDSNRLTHYYVNEALVNQMIEDLYKEDESESYIPDEDSSYITDGDVAISPLVTYQNNQQYVYHNKEYKDNNKENHDNNQRAEKPKSKKSSLSDLKSLEKQKPKKAKAPVKEKPKTKNLDQHSKNCDELKQKQLEPQAKPQTKKDIPLPQKNLEPDVLAFKENYPQTFEKLEIFLSDVKGIKKSASRSLWYELVIPACENGFSKNIENVLYSMIADPKEKGKPEYLQGALKRMKSESAQAEKVNQVKELQAQIVRGDFVDYVGDNPKYQNQSLEVDDVSSGFLTVFDPDDDKTVYY